MWGFCQPKTAPTRLRDVSYYWAVGEQQGGYAKFFSRSHHAAFSKKTGSHLGPLQKHLAISPIPLPSVAAP
jgi:hypothetical protein